jgi:hypothetical protein
MNQVPFFNFSILWYKLSSALTARSSAHPPRFDGPEIWFWVVLLLVGSVVAFMMQWTRGGQAQTRRLPQRAPPESAPIWRYSVL